MAQLRHREDRETAPTLRAGREEGGLSVNEQSTAQRPARRATRHEKLRYRFDNFMAGGGRSIFTGLVLAFLIAFVVLAVLRGVLVWIVGGTIERGGGFWRQALITFLELTDPGSMTQDIETSPWVVLTFTAVSGLVGIVLLSSLIAFLTTAIDARLVQLRKGHSKVLHDGHTVILGWNDRLIEILEELVLANESEQDPMVVVLSDGDKEEMDDFLGQYLGDTANTTVLTRSGSTSSLVDLDVVSIESAKSAIVLARCSPTDQVTELHDSDIAVIKTVLALVAATPDNSSVPIVAELFSERHRRIARGIAPAEVTVVDADDILAKILVQTSRSLGVAQVYDEMLSFDGAELYFYCTEWPDGLTFGDAAMRFEDGVPIGIRRASGPLLTNPDGHSRIHPGDELLMVASDDSLIELQSAAIAPQRPLTVTGRGVERAPERQLLVGWTRKAPTIVREYAQYVADGSAMHVLLRAESDEVRGEIDRLNVEVPNIELSILEGDPLRSDVLTEIDPFSYDEIILLSQHGSAAANDERTDSETIIILLLLRELLERHQDDWRRPKLITEVLDSSNQALVTQTGVYDFVVSNRLVSLLLAQLSEDPRKEGVFESLFTEAGAEVYCKPLGWYREELPLRATFADLMWLAGERGEVAIGVKLKAHEANAGRRHGIRLIPPKDEVFELGPDDALVVLADDES